MHAHRATERQSLDERQKQYLYDPNLLLHDRMFGLIAMLRSTNDVLTMTHVGHFLWHDTKMVMHGVG